MKMSEIVRITFMSQLDFPVLSDLVPLVDRNTFLDVELYA